MTKIITRYFNSVATARKVQAELVECRRFSPHIIDLYQAQKGVVKMLTKAHVARATAQAYRARLAKGGAVILVRAGYRPLCVARITREVTAALGAVNMGRLVEEVEIRDAPDPYANRVLTHHPLMLTRRRLPDSTHFHMANWPIPLISRRVPANLSLITPPDARMANWPIPLLSRRKPWDRFAFPRHARMANWPIPLLSRRKPYTRTLIGPHTRMANWPFPLLINGKYGAGALIPGAPRMANWPIRLISRRTPADRFAFPRHARMANWPIPLLSRRKPWDRFAFPRHARMADFILPLITKPQDAPDQDKRWSLSRALGLPTVQPR